MRPRYETVENLTKEEAVAGLLEVCWGVTLPKLTDSKLFTWDRMLVLDDSPKGFLEIKCRSHSHLTYPTLMISAAKIWRGFDFLRWFALPDGTPMKLIIAVAFADKIMWTDVAQPTQVFTWGTGGRTDRNDPADVETVCHIPMTAFKALKPKEGICQMKFNSLMGHYIDLRERAKQQAAYHTENLS